MTFSDLRQAMNAARQLSIAMKWTPNNVPEFREDAKAETAAWTVVFDMLDQLEKELEEEDEMVEEIAGIIEDNVDKIFYAKKAAQAIIARYLRKSPS